MTDSDLDPSTFPLPPIPPEGGAPPLVVVDPRRVGLDRDLPPPRPPAAATPGQPPPSEPAPGPPDPRRPKLDTDLPPPKPSRAAEEAAKAQKIPPTTVGGVVKNVAAGELDFWSWLGNTLTNQPGANIAGPLALKLGQTGYDALQPFVGDWMRKHGYLNWMPEGSVWNIPPASWPKLTPEDRIDMLKDFVNQPGDQLVHLAGQGVNKVFDALGVPGKATYPEDVKGSPLEQLARKNATAAMGALAFGGPMLPAMYGVTAGDLAAHAAPDWLAPAAEVAGNVAATAATARGAGQRISARPGEPPGPLTSPVTGPPVQSAVRERAYQIWNSQGRPQGQDKEIWNQAQTQLEKESASSPIDTFYNATERSLATREERTAHERTIANGAASPTGESGFLPGEKPTAIEQTLSPDAAVVQKAVNQYAPKIAQDQAAYNNQIRLGALDQVIKDNPELSNYFPDGIKSVTDSNGMLQLPQLKATMTRIFRGRETGGHAGQLSDDAMKTLMKINESAKTADAAASMVDRADATKLTAGMLARNPTAGRIVRGAADFAGTAATTAATSFLPFGPQLDMAGGLLLGAPVSHYVTGKMMNYLNRPSTTPSKTVQQMIEESRSQAP